MNFLFPWRFNVKHNRNDFLSYGFLQIFTFSWLNQLVYYGSKTTLKEHDLGKCPNSIATTKTFFNLSKYIKKEEVKLKRKDKISYVKIFFKHFAFRFLLTFIILVIGGVIDFSLSGISIPLMLTYFEDENGTLKTGLQWVAVIVILLTMRTFWKNLSMCICVHSGLYLRSSFQMLVYTKLLKLKGGELSSGELVNLCANDSQRLLDLGMYLAYLVYFPFHLTMIYGYLYYYFGPSSLASVLVLGLYFPIQMGLGKVFAKLRTKAIIFTDKRVKMISEALISIKLIKLYAWEESFAKVICGYRKSEKKYIYLMSLVQGVGNSLGYGMGILAPAVAIGVQKLVDGKISVPEAFALLALNNSAIIYITVGPKGIRAFAETLVAMKRLKKYMLKEEGADTYEKCDEKSENLLEISNASFCWEKDEEIFEVMEDEEFKEKDPLKVEHKPKEMNDVNRVLSKPTLQNISLTMTKEYLVGVCGAVGAGKSSLTQAILNEMNLVAGNIKLTDSIAYVPQQPWILNTTLRENILLGNEFNKQLYDEVISCCALTEDLKLLNAGDMTEIGERGVNLSGGQKQRVSLARAVYAQKDVYLLDDPLSAVDIHVGTHIFEKCIKNILKQKAVLFITHQLQYLRDCDHVIYMKDGQIKEEGKYNELIDAKKEFSEIIHGFHDEHKQDSEKEALVTDKLNNGTSNDHISPMRKASFKKLSENESVDEDVQKDSSEKGRITVAEDMGEGGVSLNTYVTFCRSAGGIVPLLLVILGIGSSVALQVLAEYSLTKYLTYEEQINIWNLTSVANSTLSDAFEKSTKYSILYWSLCSLMLVCCIISVFMTVTYILRASSSLHNAVLKKLLHTDLQFFERTPVGRIVNRFSKDVDEIDNMLATSFENFVRLFFRACGPFIFVCVMVPYYTIATVIKLVVTAFLSKIFRNILRQLKRIENVSRSPLFSHLTTTSQGLTSVRCYHRQKEFRDTFITLLDKNTNALYLYFSAIRWFSVRVDFICIFGVFLLSLIGVVFKSSITPAVFGLCLVYMFKVTGLMQFTIQQLALTESQLTCVERLNHYLEVLKPEGVFKTNKELLDDDWPIDGSLKFENVAFRYRENLPLALKNLSFLINDKEKVGIVGRTGAGKSSIANVLFRLVNIESGNISISGVDISQIGLSDLRSNLSMIPQDPVLFIGTIRYNLDPFSLYSDDELWHVLEKAHMKKNISSLSDKLETNVTENGSNFSVGERQLICMARALLRKSKILVLDEATAAIDSQTDSHIQNMIKEAFSQCTVLTIAHRLNTIMHCDRILVLENGEIVEFDSPSNLLKDDSSIFKKMASVANIKV